MRTYRAIGFVIGALSLVPHDPIKEAAQQAASLFNLFNKILLLFDLLFI